MPVTCDRCSYQTRVYATEHDWMITWHTLCESCFVELSRQQYNREPELNPDR